MKTPKSLQPLAEWARTFPDAKTFVDAAWLRINIEKRPLPGTKKRGVTPTDCKIAKYLRQTDKWGFPTKGWFDSFADFYKAVSLDTPYTLSLGTEGD